MRWIVSLSFALSLLVATFSHAQPSSTTDIVGPNYDGTFFVETEYEHVIMCGKCSRDATTVSAENGMNINTTTYFMLECLPVAQITDNLVGTLKWGCDNGCNNCAQTTEMRIGERIVYQSDKFSSQVQYNTSTDAAYAASIQCCSHVLKESLHSDGTCSDEAGSTLDVYLPLGCQFTTALATFYNGWQCPGGHGSTPIWNALCPDTVSQTTETFDTCPFRCKGFQYTNSPCVTLEGKNVTETSGTYTYHCQMDQSQMCVRMVGGISRFESANVGRSLKAVSELQCEGGFISGASFISSVSAFVVALFASALILL